MRTLVVLGAGTAGTMVVNRLSRCLDRATWRIIVVDRDDDHHYQPGYLRVVFGEQQPADVVRSRRAQISQGVEFWTGEVERVHAERDEVELKGGRVLAYDQLVIATGTTPRPEETPGLLGPLWRDRIFDFYTLDGAAALSRALDDLDSGRLVVHVCELPIKCPVAPLEYAFLADARLRRDGRRKRVSVTYVTPLPGAFTRPVAARELGQMLERRDIALEADFVVEQVDQDTRELVSYDGRRIPFDLLVTVPVNMGADFVGRSGLGDELNYVPVDRATLISTAHANIFAIGDANDLPTSKAGSVAHFSAEVFCANFVQHVSGHLMSHAFDGHATCFIESGNGKASMIDFDYTVEPLPGTFPLARVGPLSLLRETRLNHLGKLAFSWIYWHILLPGRRLPMSPLLSLSGKDLTALDPPAPPARTEPVLANTTEKES